MHNWPYVICTVMTSILLPSLSHQCDSIAFFEEKGFALEGHVIDSSYLHPDDCLWRCKANVKCFSINVKKVRQTFFSPMQKHVLLPLDNVCIFTVNCYSNTRSWLILLLTKVFLCVFHIFLQNYNFGSMRPLHNSVLFSCNITCSYVHITQNPIWRRTVES